MKKIKVLKCIGCGKEYNEEDVKYNCELCGANIDVIYDYNLVKKRITYEELKENHIYDMWRYWDILPVEDLKNLPPLKIGYTPLYKYQRFADELSIADLYIKDDSRNPSGSVKDRSSALVIKRVIETIDEEKRVVSCASNGNVALSLAMISASCGIKSVVFVPKTILTPDLALSYISGANVIVVDGSYDDAYELSIKASEKFGWYNRNTGYNPYTREGEKTIAFELCEQLEWEVCDKIFVPVGDGTLISAIWKGFLEFKKLGFIDKLPELVGVVVEESNAIYNSFVNNKDSITPVSGKTLCRSLSVKTPHDGLAALLSIRESNGFVVNVKDAEIISLAREFSSKTGLSPDLSSLSTYAALKKSIAENKVEKKDSVILILTGSGLKENWDVESKITKIKKRMIRPDIVELEKILVNLNI